MLVSRFNRSNVSGNCVFTSPGSPTSTKVFSAEIDNSAESLVTFRGRGDKPCDHWKVSSSYEKGFSGMSLKVNKVLHPTWEHWYGSVTNPAAIYPCHYSAMGVDVDHRAFAARAYSLMRPTMTTGASLTNFILELGDLKSLFKFWDRKAGLLRNAANGHLNYSFGWRPFLSDIKKFAKGMSTLDARLIQLRARAGKEQARRYSFQYDVPPITEEGVYTSTLGSFKKKVVTEFQLVRYGAKMTYTYRLPSYSSEEFYYRAVLDTLGLTLNPSQIWDALPGSFLVDWVVNVGGALERFDSSFVDPVMYIRSMLYSTKITGQQKVYIQPWVNEAPGENDFKLVATHNFSSYRRWFGLPVTFEDLSIDSDFHLGRVLLTGSLLLTRAH